MTAPAGAMSVAPSVQVGVYDTVKIGRVTFNIESTGLSSVVTALLALQEEFSDMSPEAHTVRVRIENNPGFWKERSPGAVGAMAWNKVDFRWEMVFKSDFLKGGQAVVNSGVGHELVHARHYFNGKIASDLEATLSEVAAYRWEVARTDTSAFYRQDRRNKVEESLAKCRTNADPRAVVLCQ